MRGTELIVVMCTVILIVAVTTAVIMGITAYTPGPEVRPLAKFYLENCLNLWDRAYWAASPEAVCSMLWDYRGIDTLYETAVFFLAIIGGVTVFRLIEVTPPFESLGEKIRKILGLSVIVRTISKIVTSMILIVAVAIAAHGHLTPGGGFQAGAAISVAPLMMIIALSRYFLEERKLTKEKMLVLRTVGLLAIWCTVVIPLTFALLGQIVYAMQNQPKPWTTFPGFPTGKPGTWVAGSLFIYNMAEFLAVGAGFTLIFLLLSLPEEVFREFMRRLLRR